jgi:hypothetical protein
MYPSCIRVRVLTLSFPVGAGGFEPPTSCSQMSAGPGASAHARTRDARKALQGSRIRSSAFGAAMSPKNELMYPFCTSLDGSPPSRDRRLPLLLSREGASRDVPDLVGARPILLRGPTSARHLTARARPEPGLSPAAVSSCSCARRLSRNPCRSRRCPCPCRRHRIACRCRIRRTACRCPRRPTPCPCQHRQ